jgi:hypothetical protein
MASQLSERPGIPYERAMTTNRTTRRKTIGILTGYQVYEGNTIPYYLLSVFRASLAAAESYDLHVLMPAG